MRSLSSAAAPVSEKSILVARERAVIVLCAAIALALGAFGTLGSPAWVALATVVLALGAAAWTLPPLWLVLIPVALTPLQLYVAIPGTSFTLRGTVVFLFAAALRIAAANPVALKRALRTWLLPAALFILVALVAALSAPDRYLALKGVYDWLPHFAMLLIASETVLTARARRTVVTAVIAVGVLEALLGLLEYVLGLDAILDLLRLPVSQLVFQPNLLGDRLSDLSFNWVIFDRAAPFGTFINGIDYAIFIAAVLSLLLALLIVPGSPANHPLAYAGALALGAALLLTFKGSGLLALGGGAAAVVGLAVVRSRHGAIPTRTFALALAILAGALVLALPFADLIGQRLLFLVQREQGAFGTAGRLEIWTSLLQFVLQRPFFGFGLNNATLLAEPMRTLRGGAVAYNTTTPESAYVAALIETGILGFVMLMSLFVGTLIRGLRQIRASTEPAIRVGVWAAICAILVGNLTVAGFTTDQNGILLGALMGMVWANGVHGN